MHKSSKKAKLILIILGAGLAAFAIEIFLNIISPTCYNKRPFPSEIKSRCRENVCQIICLGDSFTYGLGAGFDNSYPAQLELILNNSYPNKLFQVQNLGIPGETSKQTLKKLLKILDKTKPDIVIILTGVNDNWSFADYFKSRLFESINQFNISNLNLKIFKMAHLLSYNLRTPIPLGSDIMSIIKTANKLRAAKNFKQAELYYEQALNIEPSNPTALLEMARSHKLNKQYLKASITLEKAFSLNPRNKEIQNELSDLFIKQKNIKQEFAVLLRLKHKFPRNKYLMERLVFIYSILGEPYFSNNLAKKISAGQSNDINLDFLNQKGFAALKAYYDKNKPVNNLYKPKWLNQFSWKAFNHNSYSISKIRYKNLEKAINICQQKKIDLIISSYPAILFEDTKNLAEKYNIPLVDNRQTFYDLLQIQPASKLFVSEYDRHCTAEGYKAIAKNIAAEVLKIVAK